MAAGPIDEPIDLATMAPPGAGAGHHINRRHHPRRGIMMRLTLQRIDEPGKNWKFSLADVEEREFWKDYMKAYEACLNSTSTRHAPWYAIPADDKENARLIVSQIVLDTLEGLKMIYPKTSAKRRQELVAIRKRLAK
jgi:hypothetical protein